MLNKIKGKRHRKKTMTSSNSGALLITARQVEQPQATEITKAKRQCANARQMEQLQDDVGEEEERGTKTINDTRKGNRVTER